MPLHWKTALVVKIRMSSSKNRIIDSESKILHDIAKRLGDNKSASGTIKIYTDWNCCPSCMSVIEQFSKKYPKIKIEVVYKKSK